MTTPIEAVWPSSEIKNWQTSAISKELSNNIVVSGGFSLGTEAVDLDEPNSQDAWGLYSNIGYKFEIAEFDIILRSVLTIWMQMWFDDSASNDINIDNVYGSIRHNG